MGGIRLACDLGGAIWVIYFPTIWIAKEIRNLPNHRVYAQVLAWPGSFQGRTPTRWIRFFSDVLLKFPLEADQVHP